MISELLEKISTCIIIISLIALFIFGMEYCAAIIKIGIVTILTALIFTEFDK